MFYFIISYKFSNNIKCNMLQCCNKKNNEKQPTTMKIKQNASITTSNKNKIKIQRI